jgi:hypothetical protein
MSNEEIGGKCETVTGDLAQYLTEIIGKRRRRYFKIKLAQS